MCGMELVFIFYLAKYSLQLEAKIVFELLDVLMYLRF